MMADVPVCVKGEKMIKCNVLLEAVRAYAR